MRVLEKLIAFTKIQGQTPDAYGKLHLACIFAVILLSLLLAVCFRDVRDKRFRLLIGLMFIVMLVGELIKQTVYPLSIVDGAITVDYDFSTFPFQLCSTPLYVLPFLCLLPDGRARDIAAAYTMSYGLLGGLAVYISPGAVFVSNMFLSCHSMLHHGLQILTGVYTAAYYRRRIDRPFILGAIGVFTVVFGIANLLNTVVHDILIAKEILPYGDAFNMFYISPRPEQRPMMLADLYYRVHPAIYIAGYYVTITLAALILIYATYLLNKLARKHAEKVREKHIVKIALLRKNA